MIAKAYNNVRIVIDQKSFVMTYTFNRPAFPSTRMRRIRKNDRLRDMVSETQLTADHLIYPVFVLPGQNQAQDIASMPNIQRLSADLLLKKADNIKKQKKRFEFPTKSLFIIKKHVNTKKLLNEKLLSLFNDGRFSPTSGS